MDRCYLRYWHPVTLGRYGGGTYAHKDIAFEFGSWLSPEFKLYLIKEFQRLKEDENHRLSIGWNLNRTLSKLNYRIHTDAIKSHIIPKLVSKVQLAANLRVIKNGLRKNSATYF
jgi:hypothetical protein